MDTSPQSSPKLGEGDKIFRRAFTLVELLVVIAIIGLLSTVAVVSLDASRMNARNAKRKADMVQVSKALELYYADHGAYPSTGGGSNWRGACSGYGGLPDVDPSNYPTDTSWIPGLTNGGYMASLPRDPLTEKNNPNAPYQEACGTSKTGTCFLYTSNGIDYKLLAHCTPEGSWTSSDPFYDVRSIWAWQITNNHAVTYSW